MGSFWALRVEAGTTLHPSCLQLLPKASWFYTWISPHSILFSLSSPATPLSQISIISCPEYFNQFHMGHLSGPATPINPYSTKQPCEREPFHGSLVPSMEASASLAKGTKPFVIRPLVLPLASLHAPLPLMTALQKQLPVTHVHSHL